MTSAPKDYEPKQGTDTLNAKSQIDIISLSIESLRKASVVRDLELDEYGK